MVKHFVVFRLFKILFKIVCLLVAIAYYTIAERKIMAAIQRRRGPNVVGFWGLLQPLADGLKLIAKEMVIPRHSNARVFVVAPIVILTLSLINWSIIPFGCGDYTELAPNETLVRPLFAGRENVPHPARFIAFADCGTSIGTAASLEYEPDFDFQVTPFTWFADCWAAVNSVSDVRYGLLVILAISSLSVYGLIVAGWASNSKYAFLGALRSAAQMISYEVSISLVIIPVIFMSASLNLTEIVVAQTQTVYYVFPLITLSVIFFISMIAETNRTPFDLPEAEAELVAGYNVEYSSIIFAMFFLAEYGNMILMSIIKAELFLGGWSGPFLPSSVWLALKTLVFCFAFVLVRATFPRYRYDQLMDIGWKIFLPLTTGLLLLIIGTIMAFDAAPVATELYFSPYAEPQLS